MSANQARISCAQAITSVLPDSSPRLQAALRVASAAARLVESYSTQPTSAASQPAIDSSSRVLAEGELAVQHRGDPAQPGPAFDQELLGREVRVLAAQPVHRDAQAVQRGRRPPTTRGAG